MENVQEYSWNIPGKEYTRAGNESQLANIGNRTRVLHGRCSYSHIVKIITLNDLIFSNANVWRLACIVLSPAKVLAQCLRRPFISQCVGAMPVSSFHMPRCWRNACVALSYAKVLAQCLYRPIIRQGVGDACVILSYDKVLAQCLCRPFIRQGVGAMPVSSFHTTRCWRNACVVLSYANVLEQCLYRPFTRQGVDALHVSSFHMPRCCALPKSSFHTPRCWRNASFSVSYAKVLGNATLNP